MCSPPLPVTKVNINNNQHMTTRKIYAPVLRTKLWILSIRAVAQGHASLLPRR